MKALKNIVRRWADDDSLSDQAQHECGEFIFKVLILMSRLEVGIWPVDTAVVEEVEETYNALKMSFGSKETQVEDNVQHWDCIGSDYEFHVPKKRRLRTNTTN